MPLYNIFKKTKEKPKKTPIIIADIHEKNSLVISELHNSKEITSHTKPLKIGDYLLGEIIIERKTTSDLISSMINKRLIQQLKQMKKYPKQILIIEGDLQEIYIKKDNISKAVRGFILSIITNYQVPVIQTASYKDTANYLITLAKQQLKPSTPTTLHSRIPKTIQEQKQYILEAFPNIGPSKAKKLLEKFKTISNTINAKEEELEEILKKQTKEFKELIEG